MNQYMPDQSQVTSTTKHHLRLHHPELLRDQFDRPDGSFECQLQSPSKHFSIWIASYNCEITVGLQSPDGDSGCHTHFTPYRETDLPGVLASMSELMKDIMNDEVLFYHSSVHGYSWTSDRDALLEEKQPHETIMFFSWWGKLTREKARHRAFSFSILRCQKRLHFTRP